MRLSWLVRCPSFLDSINISCELLGFPLLFGAEHYQPLEIALTNIGEHYLKVDLFHVEFCNDVAFW
jgi:hypothetical protein